MFLKFGHTARPIESLKEISVRYEDDVEFTEVEEVQVKRKVKKLRLRLEFTDGSAWSFDLPDWIDREKFLKWFLKGINRRTITDVPEVVEKLTKGVKK